MPSPFSSRSPSEPPAEPSASSSGEMTNASPAPIEDGLRLVIEKEKKVEKLAGVGVPGWRNLTGLEYKTFPAPE